MSQDLSPRDLGWMDTCQARGQQLKRFDNWRAMLKGEASAVQGKRLYPLAEALDIWLAICLTRRLDWFRLGSRDADRACHKAKGGANSGLLYSLAGGDGLGTLRHIKAVEDGRQIPVAAMGAGQKTMTVEIHPEVT